MHFALRVYIVIIIIVHLDFLVINNIISYYYPLSLRAGAARVSVIVIIILRTSYRYFAIFI